MNHRLASPPSSAGSSLHRRDTATMSSPRETPASQADPSSSRGTPLTSGPTDEDDMYRNLSPPASAASSLRPAASGIGSAPGTIISVAGTTDFDDMSKYPASMTSSVRAHVYEGGLRYHAYKDGKYAFPNDDVEQNRDDMKHAMTLMLMRGKHFYAPMEEVLEEGGEVLDLGTGTGIWAIELAEKYPKAIVHGVDLSPIQPTYVTENVFFAVDDIEDDWVYGEETLDYIHIRHVIFSIRDRRTLLERAYKHLKPGGYIEVQELQFVPHCDDESMTDETPYALRDFLRYIGQGLQALGTELHSIATIPDELGAAGFENITKTTHKCPIGVWPRDKRMRYCGLFMRTAIMDGLRGLVKRPLGNGLGWTQIQIEMFLVDVRKAVMDAKFHSYLPFHVVYGRKPLG